GRSLAGEPYHRWFLPVERCFRRSSLLTAVLSAMLRNLLFGLADVPPKVLGIFREVANRVLPFSNSYKVCGHQTVLLHAIHTQSVPAESRLLVSILWLALELHVVKDKEL